MNEYYLLLLLLLLSFWITLIFDPGFLNFTFQRSVDAIFPGPLPPLFPIYSPYEHLPCHCLSWYKISRERDESQKNVGEGGTIVILCSLQRKQTTKEEKWAQKSLGWVSICGWPTPSPTPPLQKCRNWISALLKWRIHLNIYKRKTQKIMKNGPPAHRVYLSPCYVASLWNRSLSLRHVRSLLPATTWLSGSYLKHGSYYRTAGLGTRVPTGTQLI